MQTIPLHKDLEILFQKQQEEQRKLNKTAEARKNLKETQQTMYAALDKLVARNNDLQMTESAANELVASSEEFMQQSKQLNTCWPEWWWCKCKTNSNNAKGRVRMHIL